MKKVIKVKEIITVLIAVLILTVSTSIFASEFVLGNDEYSNAQTPIEETIPDSDTNTNTNTNTNKAKTYNTNDDDDEDLPQTGIEDYNIGILLVICVASAIFAYKKINDYKNV